MSDTLTAAERRRYERLQRERVHAPSMQWRELQHWDALVEKGLARQEVVRTPVAGTADVYYRYHLVSVDGLSVGVGADVGTIVLWHGSKRWDGPPRIVESRKGRVEYGPGIYLTTSIDTARKYSKGGGSVMRFEVARDLRWLEDSKIDYHHMLEFLRSRPRLRNRDKIIDDIGRYLSRRRDGGFRGDDIPAAVLVNLMVNHQAVTGEHGPALAEFYVANGIDAGVDHKGSEDWVVLFNPKKIVSHRKVPASERADDAPRVERRA